MDKVKISESMQKEAEDIISMLEGKLTAEELQKICKFINKISGYEV